MIGFIMLIYIVDVVILMIKVMLFGLMVGLIVCYKGMLVGGGLVGVGWVVNEIVVFVFIVLFVINIVVIVVGILFMVF